MTTSCQLKTESERIFPRFNFWGDYLTLNVRSEDFFLLIISLFRDIMVDLMDVLEVRFHTCEAWLLPPRQRIVFYSRKHHRCFWREGYIAILLLNKLEAFNKVKERNIDELWQTINSAKIYTKLLSFFSSAYFFQSRLIPAINPQSSINKEPTRHPLVRTRCCSRSPDGAGCSFGF